MMLPTVALTAIVLNFLMWVNTKSLWSDEFFTWHLVHQPWVEVVKLSLVDVHPPLYFLVAKLYSYNEMTLRGLSHLFTLGTVVSAYMLAKHLVGKQVAVMTAFLIAISPYFLQSSNEVRGYAMLGFLVTLGTLAYEKGWVKTFAMCAILVPFTEHYGWIWVAVMAYRVWLDAFEDMINAACWITLCITPLFVLLVFQAFYGEGVHQLGRLVEYWNPVWLGKKLVGIPWHMTVGYSFTMMTGEAIGKQIGNPLLWVNALAVFCACALALFGCGQRRVRYYVVGLLVIPTLLLLVFYPIRLHARYLIFAAPFFYIAVAHGLVIATRWIQVMVIAVMLGASLYAIYLPTDACHRHDYREQVEDAFEPSVEIGKGKVPRLIVGNTPQVRYYHPQFEDWAVVSDELTNWPQAEEVWVLAIGNMQESVNQRNQVALEKEMLDKGYRLSQSSVMRNPRRYGLNLTYLFERAK